MNCCGGKIFLKIWLGALAVLSLLMLLFKVGLP